MISDNLITDKNLEKISYKAYVVCFSGACIHNSKINLLKKIYIVFYFN